MSKMTMRNERNQSQKKRRVTDLSVRLSGAPLVDPPGHCVSQNIVKILQGRETSGPLRRRETMLSHFYRNFDVIRTIYGHQHVIQQLLYDHTGEHYVTCSVDGLVKKWSAHDGRLLDTFRSDIGPIWNVNLSYDDRLLVARGNKSLTVWCFRTKKLISILENTEHVKSIFFFTKSWYHIKYLVVVTFDVTVKFFSYEDDGNVNNIKFHFPLTQPVEFGESKYRTKITSSTSMSSCGSYLLVGSQHVRVFTIDRLKGPQCILNVTAIHTSSISLVQWSNTGERFLTSITEGIITLWNLTEDLKFERRKVVLLSEVTRICGLNLKKISFKIMALCWDANDQHIVTAHEGGQLFVWNPNTGELLNIIHTTETVRLLAAHPIDSGIIACVSRDEDITIWDVINASSLISYNQKRRSTCTYPISDIKWSPDGDTLLITDRGGYVKTYGYYPKTQKTLVPKELFFHTDYQPLIHDADGRLVDKETRLPPHLMPPPYLVDREGNPYEPALQRLVPGREHCTDDELTLSVSTLYGIYKYAKWYSPRREEIEWGLEKYMDISDRAC